MTRREITRWGLVVAIGTGLMGQTARAQSLGTFRWQLQPFCNVVVVQVTQQGGSYRVDGFDDQCGAERRAPLVGLATPNPDGTIGFGLHVVVPGGRPVHVDARIALGSLGGPWSDSSGNSGTFVFNGAAAGSPRPAPTIPGAAIAAGSITSAHLAAGSVGPAAIAPGAIGAGQLAPGTVAGAVAGFGTCPVGQYLRGILPSGSPVCEPIGTPPVSTSVDTANIVGVYTAIAIGTDGLPIVAHYNQTAGDLRVTHCSNLACTAAVSTDVDTGPAVTGWFPSIRIGSDGLPIIAHTDITTDADLRVTHCSNVACTAATSVTVDAAGATGSQPSLAIGPDGLPLIAHYDSTNGELRVTHCGTVTCSTSTSTNVDTVGNPGIAAALAIGADGLGIISHVDLFTVALRVTHCSNAACSAATTVTIPGAVATDTELVIVAGLPVILQAVGTAKMTYCLDVACTSSTSVTVPDAAAGMGLAIGTDGSPIYASAGGGSGDLLVTRCATAACGSATTTTADSPNAVGAFPAIAIGSDGLPVISHFDDTTDDLRVTKCNSRSCQ